VSGREGFQNTGSCCDLVLVDESAEYVAALDGSGAWWIGFVDRFGRLKAACAMWALAVVVGRVGAEHVFEVAAAEDQQPVETLGAHRPDEPLSVGVRLWRADGRVDHLAAFAAEDFVGGGGELAVSVVDQEPRPLEQTGEAEVARLLGDPGAGRLVVQPARWRRRLSSSMKKST
jgi:hypothetical protein